MLETLQSLCVWGRGGGNVGGVSTELARCCPDIQVGWSNGGWAVWFRGGLVSLYFLMYIDHTLSRWRSNGWWAVWLRGRRLRR